MKTFIGNIYNDCSTLLHYSLWNIILVPILNLMWKTNCGSYIVDLKKILETFVK